MKKVTLLLGFLASLLSLGAHAQAQVWHMTHGLDHALVLTSTAFSGLTVILSVLVFALPASQVDLDRLAKERALRDAEREEKVRAMQLRQASDALLREEAVTRKAVTEAHRMQLLYEDDQRRIQRNARARDRRRRQQGLPPEAPIMTENHPSVPEPAGGSDSALDLILADDDDSV